MSEDFSKQHWKLEENGVTSELGMKTVLYWILLPVIQSIQCEYRIKIHKVSKILPPCILLGMNMFRKILQDVFQQKGGRTERRKSIKKAAEGSPGIHPFNKNFGCLSCARFSSRWWIAIACQAISFVCLFVF